MQIEYPEIREQMRSKGYEMSDQEWADHIAYARRKAEVAGKSEDYLPLLLPDVVKEHYIRTAINSFTMGLMELERQIKEHFKEVNENANTTAKTTATAG